MILFIERLFIEMYYLKPSYTILIYYILSREKRRGKLDA